MKILLTVLLTQFFAASAQPRQESADNKRHKEERRYARRVDRGFEFTKIPNDTKFLLTLEDLDVQGLKTSARYHLRLLPALKVRVETVDKKTGITIVDGVKRLFLPLTRNTPEITRTQSGTYQTDTTSITLATIQLNAAVGEAIEELPDDQKAMGIELYVCLMKRTTEWTSYVVRCAAEINLATLENTLRQTITSTDDKLKAVKDDVAIETIELSVSKN